MLHFKGLGRGATVVAVLMTAVSAGALNAVAGGFQVKE